MTRTEIVATSVTFEQENLTSPIKLSFTTTQRVLVEHVTSLSGNVFTHPMALWRDYLIGSYAREQPRTCGIFLWSMKESSVFYFEVCHLSYPLRAP